MPKITVYVDRGVSGDSLYHTYKSIKSDPLLQGYSIQRLGAKELKETAWEKESALLIVPGGQDIFYERALAGEGTDKIKAFVRNGGAYLGICAGGYFGAGAIEFEKGCPIEVCGPRQLQFFPGIARGSAYGPNRYAYDSAKGVEAAFISWNGQSIYTYFNGGCYFADAETFSNTLILSRYQDIEGAPAAIIACNYGKGRAILSGVHFEYSTRFLSGVNPYHKQILPLLEKDEEKRRQLCSRLLSLLLNFLISAVFVVFNNIFI